MQPGKVQSQEVVMSFNLIAELHFSAGYATAQSKQPCPSAMKYLFLSKHMLELLLFLLLSVQRPNSNFWIFLFHIWETSCFVVTGSKELYSKNVDSVQMAQLRNILCHCLSIISQQVSRQGSPGQLDGLWPQGQAVVPLCMSAQTGG